MAVTVCHNISMFPGLTLAQGITTLEVYQILNVREVQGSYASQWQTLYMEVSRETQDAMRESARNYQNRYNVTLRAAKAMQIWALVMEGWQG